MICEESESLTLVYITLLVGGSKIVVFSESSSISSSPSFNFIYLFFFSLFVSRIFSRLDLFLHIGVLFYIYLPLLSSLRLAVDFFHSTVDLF